jgi:hypothetical protein
MASRGKKKAVAHAADVANIANIANIAKANPYVQRLIDDADLRANMQKAYESSRKAYERLTNGKPPHKALLEDKKLQHDLRDAVEALREASSALAEAPKRRARKSRRLGRKLLVVSLAGALALAGSEKLRSKVLDTLFGKEEEFEYTPPPGAGTTPPASPVTAA